MSAYRDLEKKHETLMWSEMPKLVGVILSYGKDVYDEDDLEKAAAELAQLRKRVEAAERLVEFLKFFEWDETTGECLVGCNNTSSDGHADGCIWNDEEVQSALSDYEKAGQG